MKARYETNLRTRNTFEFSRNTESWQIWQCCATPNGNKLLTVFSLISFKTFVQCRQFCQLSVNINGVKHSLLLKTADTPLDRHPQTPQADTHSLEMATAADGTHPTGMHSGSCELFVIGL